MVNLIRYLLIRSWRHQWSVGRNCELAGRPRDGTRLHLTPESLHSVRVYECPFAGRHGLVEKTSLCIRGRAHGRI